MDKYIKCDKCNENIAERHITQYIGLRVNLCTACDNGQESAREWVKSIQDCAGQPILPAKQYISGDMYKDEIRQPAWVKDSIRIRNPKIMEQLTLV